MTRLSRDDSGQITTAVVMVGIVAVVWLGLAVAKFGQAIDEKSHYQTAADAAALAGAQQIRTQIPGLLRISLEGSGAGSFMPDGCGRLGKDAAIDFAGRAGSEVTDYCYDPSSDTVRVSVIGRADSVVTGSPSKTRAKAEARVGLILGDCQMSGTSTPTVAPSPPSTPSPPAPSDILCGDLPIRMTPNPGGGGEIDMSDSDILSLFTPRLKS
jgi:hypothetical protein